MKIQGPNSLINIYKNSQNNVVKAKKSVAQQDKIDISFAAKKLQRNEAATSERSKQVSDIKQLVQTGEYKVNHNQTAADMISFFEK